MEQPPVSKMSVSRGALLSVATNSAFRWSPIGEVTESLSLNSRNVDEFYPELMVHLERPPETVDSAGRTFDCSNCVLSPQSRSPTGRNVFTANGCSKQDKVKVYVRMRPFSESEKVCPLKHVLCLIGETIVVRDLDQKLTGISKEPPHKAEAIEFKVDYMQDDSYLQVHSETHKEESQKRMYGALGVPCIESALDGYNTTILAYGQTGSGKTYTMMGDNTKAGRGLIPRLANDLMTKIHEESSNGVLYTVQVSYLEIYQEKIRDLLAEDEQEEEAKPSSVSQHSSESNGTNSPEKVRAPEVKLRLSGNHLEEKVRVSSNSLEEKVFSSYAGSLTENSYTSSFLNKAALQRQLEASQKHIRIKAEAEKPSSEKPNSSTAADGGINKAKSPKTKPVFDTVFSKQKVHKHYRTFPTVMEEAAPVRKQNFLKIREHPITGPFVDGLLWKDVLNWYDMENLMKQGSTSRTTAATDMNEQSSRSHAVFSIRLTKKLGPDLFGVQPSSVSYINLVDLAGSEKLPKLCSGAVTGQRTQEESRCINRSLSQLNEVILSLSKSSFVSYRNSVLTWLLKESLGGNSRTFMVANISPTEKDLRESINTLRYATTASRIPPPVALDQDPRNKLIKKLKEEICTLRTLLSSLASVKENAPSGQLPSLQGFKVPCLDVGLQVEDNSSHDEDSNGKKLHESLEKGCQTENHVRDVGQQTPSKSQSVDPGFQIALMDGAALDNGNPTALQDFGRVDLGHQPLILNVCACDCGHQASPNQCGVLEVTVAQHSTLRDCVATDVCLQRLLSQPSGSLDLGQQNPLRNCGILDIANQIGLRDGDLADQLLVQISREGDLGNPLRVQEWGAAVTGSEASLPDGWKIDDRTNLRNQGYGDMIVMPGREDVDATHLITMQNCSDSNVGNQTSLNWGPVDTETQISLRGWGNVDAGNQVALRNWGDVNAESQVSLRDVGLVDVELRTSCSDLRTTDVGNQTTTRAWGETDAAHQTNAVDRGSKDAGHQTTLQGRGVNKATGFAIVQMDVTQQIDWRDFGASDAGFQVSSQNPVMSDSGYQVSWMDFGACDNGDQISWRDFASSDAGHQVTADDFPSPRHPHIYSTNGEVVDDQVQVESRGLKCNLGQHMSWAEFYDIGVNTQVSFEKYNQEIVPDQQFPENGPPKNLSLTGVRLQTAHRHCWVVDAIQQTDEISLSSSDVQLQADFGTRDIGQHEVMCRDSGTDDLELPDSLNDVGYHNPGIDNSHTITRVCCGEDVDQQTAGKNKQRGHQQICLYPSTTIDNASLTTSSKETFPRGMVNPNNVDWRRHGAVEVSHPHISTNLRAVDVMGCEASLRVGRVEQIKEQFERRSISAQQFGHRITTSGRPGVSVGQQVSPRCVGQVSVALQTSLSVENSASTNSQVVAELGHASNSQDCGRATEADLQANLKIDGGTFHAGRPTSWDGIDMMDSQACVRDDADVKCRCKAAFEDYLSTLQNKSTTTDFGSLEGDRNSLDKCRAAEDFACQAAFEDCLSTLRHKCTSTDFGALEDQWNSSNIGRAVEDFACQAAFEDCLSTLRHKSTATDFWALEGDRNSLDLGRAVEQVTCRVGVEDYLSSQRRESTSADVGLPAVDRNTLDTYRIVEAWKCLQCGVCGATPGNPMVVVSTMVPIQGVAADVGLQTSWIDVCASASELQTPTTRWGVSSEPYAISPNALEGVDEGSQADWGKLHSFQEQHWNHFEAGDFIRQARPKTSKSLDLEEFEEKRPLISEEIHEAPHKHWREELKSCNSRFENCEQDYGVQKWQQHQASHGVGRDCAIHNWQHHQHGIMLSEPSYLVTEADAGTFNTEEETRSWNASWGSIQQSPHVYLDDSRDLEFLQDAKLEKSRHSNAECLQQCSDFRPTDICCEARDFPTVQQPSGLHSMNHTLQETTDAMSTKTQALKKGVGEEANTGIPQNQTMQEDRSRESDFSHQTDLQRNRLRMPLEHLQASGLNESEQLLNGKLRSDQDGICLSWLHNIIGGGKLNSGNVPAEEAFQLCSLWTLAKLRSRMEWHSIHSEKEWLKYRCSLATKCRGLVSQPLEFSTADAATQTDFSPEDSRDRKANLSNTLQQICLLWVFVSLRLAASQKGSLAMEGKRLVGEKSPFLGTASSRKVRIWSCHSDSAVDERRSMSRRLYHRPSRLRHLRYSGVEPLKFQSTTPFFIQTSGDCSLVRTRVDKSPPPSGNTVVAAAGGSRHYKITCGFPSRRMVHFLKEGVNRLGSNRGAQIVVNGLSEDHSEFIYMPPHRCVQNKGYVVARLVAPGAMAFLNGMPMLEHKELSTGDVLVLRDLRYRSSVCTLHFFDLVKFS